MKIRLDQLLVIKNLAPSREKAKAMILANNVLVNNVPALKAGELVEQTVAIKIRGESLKYVSRAGYKLEKALNTFNLNVENLIALDIGASTGGFTDCLLQNNVQKVYAIDVGTNQLEWKIRTNPKVISYEKTNFRYVTKDLFGNDEISFACCDVSFISLDKILPVLQKIISEKSNVIVLIKPQFETTREKVNKGKINDKIIHQEVINKIMVLSLANHFSFLKLDYSPITGGKKANIEFIALLQESENPVTLVTTDDIKKTIENAWNNLEK